MQVRLLSGLPAPFLTPEPHFLRRFWRLSLRDMTSSLRVLPAVRIAYLAYVQMKLLQLLTEYPTDEQYCEVCSVLLSVWIIKAEV